VYFASAVNGNLVLIRNSSCDAIWILHPNREGCYSRSTLLTELNDVAGQDITAALEPTGTFLFLIIPYNASSSLLYSYDILSEQLACLILPLHAVQPTLAVSRTLCAVGTSNAVLLFGLSNASLTNASFSLHTGAVASVALQDNPARVYTINSTGELMFFDLRFQVLQAYAQLFCILSRLMGLLAI
jgi:hypothetical protein